MKSLQSLSPERFESPEILKQLNLASRALAELKGVVLTIPNERILLNTLGLQEAKDSSEIENIVTTQDELYRDQSSPHALISAEAKEVLRYREAIDTGYELVKESGLITVNHLTRIQSVLTDSDSGIRTMPGTALKNARGETVYIPPQDHQDILRSLRELEVFTNDETAFDADPLVKMALIHHQFESIHPFYDGNGRTGRILNVLYLVKDGLLDLPVLYLSRPLMENKATYYRLLQEVRDNDAWEAWVLFMLTAVRLAALEAHKTVAQIQIVLLTSKHRIRSEHKFYSQDLINHLFSYPYTKIEWVMRALKVSRITATRYLDALSSSGILEKHRYRRSNYYVNAPLLSVLSGVETNL